MFLTCLSVLLDVYVQIDQFFSSLQHKKETEFLTSVYGIHVAIKNGVEAHITGPKIIPDASFGSLPSGLILSSFLQSGAIFSWIACPARRNGYVRIPIADPTVVNAPNTPIPMQPQK